MQAVILAAGESSRFWPLNTQHKSLTRLYGKAVIEWTIESIKSSGILEKDIIVIQDSRKDIELKIKKNYPKINFVVQLEAKGMGNALVQVESLIDDSFLVLNPNYIEAKYYIELLRKKKEASDAKIILTGMKTNNPELYGIFKLEGDKATELVEKPKPEKSPSDIRTMGVYLLSKEFFKYYKKIPEHRYAYEEALSLCMKALDVKVAFAEKDSLSLKYPWHILKLKETLLERKNSQISKSARIEKNAVIENSYIGENVRIFENSVIKNSYLGDNSTVGNFSLVRDSAIERDCLIGAHCEIAKCAFGENVHVHSGYFGDTIIGANCRIGAGMITANARLDREEIKSVVMGEKVGTGLKSFGCVIGENTKLGINVSTMPGILIGSNCIVGPSVIVRENIPDSSKIR